MINILGQKEYTQLSDSFKEYKRSLADKAEYIKDEYDYSLRAIADNSDSSPYKVSFALRNPETIEAEKILTILTTLYKMTSDFDDREIKYVLHQTWIRPKNAEPFFVNGGTVANLYSVDLEDCVLDDFATEEQMEKCVHLRVVAK